MEANGVRPNAVTYNAIIACCVRANLPTEAAELLQLMRKREDPNRCDLL